jgi:hypothetical protein
MPARRGIDWGRAMIVPPEILDCAALDDFQKSDGVLATQKPPIFERADWSLFRTLEGLQQRAGVPSDLLSRLLLKELADNALDNGAAVRVQTGPNAGAYVVEDDGAGIDGRPEDIARLFSIGRSMVSSKLLRLPTRGALGNGLRVVAGAIIVSGGSLAITTRNRRIELRPERDGTTTVINVETVEFPVGTRIEIRLGPAIRCDGQTLDWMNVAQTLAEFGTQYGGKSSPWWYDPGQFHELLYASGNRPVRDLIASLDGCSGGKAGEIVNRAGLERTACRDVTFAQTEKLLEIARANARQVAPKRLGAVGPDAFRSYAHAVAEGTACFGATFPQAQIPFVVEVWAQETPEGKTCISACVNRTPVTGDLRAARDKRDIDAFGCGLNHTLTVAPQSVQFDVWLNITTPYMPITSDGKAPNLRPFLDAIQTAAAKAVRRAHRPQGGNRLSQKHVILDNLDAVIDEVSGGRRYRFNQRQLLYRLRPIVREEIGEELSTTNFATIITDVEAENDEIPGMYREPRGTLYHPHRGETIALGTLMVENYERPPWLYNKLVYIEKEGFSEALKEERWPERHDCAPLSSKGFTTRAARDLVDYLAEHDEPITIFCVHDADAFGSMIYETFQEATRARGARKIKVINLGLEPWEALEMGLEIETVPASDRRKAVAAYIDEHEYPCGVARSWSNWLQTHRVELNAMSTPQFIAWLDRKMAGYDKLVPPEHVLIAELESRIADKVRADITSRILREARADEQIAAAVAAIETPDSATFAQGIRQLFATAPDREWRDYIESVAADLTDREMLR